MILWLSEYLQNYVSAFHVFHYISFRTALAALVSLILSISIGPWLIKRLQKMHAGQVVRDDGPQTHLAKAGTPTMGGVLIVLAIVVTTLLFADLANRYVWIVLLTTISYAIVGGVDDYKKLTLQNSKGISAKQKFFWQIIIALIVGIFLYATATKGAQTQLLIPFFKGVTLNLGWLFPALVLCVIVGSSNAVNLTDGLDGLAIVPTVLVGGALGIFAYVTGHIHHAHYLSIPYIPGVGEIAIFCGALIGAGLGFLWFNCYPAQIFMGDVGSLSLGAALGVVAVLVRQELVFFIMGGIFVMETLSVILQVASFKLTGKRIFKMSPLHHHFELSGWPEPKVIVRFWIMSTIFVLIGLASLKLR